MVVVVSSVVDGGKVVEVLEDVVDGGKVVEVEVEVVGVVVVVVVSHPMMHVPGGRVVVVSSGGCVVVVVDVDVVDVVVLDVVVVDVVVVVLQVRPSKATLPVLVPVAPFDQRADTVTEASVALPGAVVWNWIDCESGTGDAEVLTGAVSHQV